MFNQNDNILIVPGNHIIYLRNFASAPLADQELACRRFLRENGENDADYCVVTESGQFGHQPWLQAICDAARASRIKCMVAASLKVLGHGPDVQATIATLTRRSRVFVAAENLKLDAYSPEGTVYYSPPLDVADVAVDVGPCSRGAEASGE